MKQKRRQSRRQFLRDSVAAAATVGNLHMITQAEPTTRQHEVNWAIACRDAHLRDVDEPDVWSAMHAIGVEGVEAQVDADLRCPALFHPKREYSLRSPEAIRTLKQDLEAAKMKISALCLMNRFDEQPDVEVEFVRRVAGAAVELGVSAIRLDVVPRKIKDEAEFLKFAVGIGQRVIRETGDTGVRFGVENHGGTTNKPEFLEKLFEGIGSDRFGLTLDTANFYWFGHPLSKLYEIYRRFARSVCHTHCKSIRYPEAEREKQRPMGWEYGRHCCPVYEGDIDFRRVAEILRAGGYRGDLCIENESLERSPKEQRRGVLAKEAAFLRSIARPG